MTEQEIIEGNRLIAEFDGWRQHASLTKKLCKLYGADMIIQDSGNLQYHTSWDWLIPVCKKFNDLCMNDEALRKEWLTVKGKRGSVIGKKYVDYCDLIDFNLALYEINNVWNCLVEAIQWYQTQTPTK